MWFLECPKAPASEHTFEINKLVGQKHCWNVWRRSFDANFQLIWDKSSTERSLIVRSDILGLCFNRLTGEHMYSRLNREIFPQLVWTQLCQKAKTFSEIFTAFLKSTWNFEHFGKKEELHRLNISEVIDTEECIFLNSRKLLLQNTLLKSTS